MTKKQHSKVSLKKTAPVKTNAASTRTTDNQQSKSRILAAALTVFAKHGFEGARTRDIAELAQVNIATLHYHFKSKDNIYASVIEEIHRRSGEQIMSVMIAQKEIISSSTDKKALIKALKVMAIAFVTMITNPKNKELSKIISHEQVDQSKHFKILFETVMKRVCEPFTIAVSKITGKEPEAIDVILTTHSLHGILTAFLHNKSSLFYLSGWKSYNKENVERINQHISRMIDTLFEKHI